MRRREIERIGLGWMSSVISSQDCLTSMTDVYDAAIESSLLWAIRNQCRQRDLEETQAPASICLIAMGRYGGREVNFSSDADLMMIYEEAGTQASDGQAASFAKAVVADPTRPIRIITPTGPRLGSIRPCCGLGTPPGTGNWPTAS